MKKIDRRFEGFVRLATCKRIVVSVAVFLISAGANSQSFSLLEATINDVHASLIARELSCRELVEGYIQRIEAYDQRGPDLNAVQHVNALARDEADQLDSAFSGSGLVGPLHCVPVLLKDQVETSDMPTTYGSSVYSGFISGRDATIVTRLKDAGAIILAKTNMGEYASRYMGSAFGVIRNAYEPSRNPSGSSGGTAAAVAANLGLVGIGEDTGGSIRGPAAVHSLVGLRPSVPLVSRFGMMPSNPSQDTLGPITRTVRDAAILLDAIAGYDSNDPATAYSVGNVADSYVSSLHRDGLRGARIGVVRESMDPKTDPESEDYKQVRTVIDRAYRDLAALGADVIDPIVVPGLDQVDGLYRANRFESEEAINEYLAKLPDAPVKTFREILLTGQVSPVRAKALMSFVGRSTNEEGYLDILLGKEQLRTGILNVMAEHELDAVVYATFDHQPTVIPDDVLTNADAEDGYGLGNNRYFSPLVALPAITVPAGLTADGLPVGLEFLGREFSEATLLRFAYAYEQATHRRALPKTTPPLSGVR